MKRSTSTMETRRDFLKTGALFAGAAALNGPAIAAPGLPADVSGEIGVTTGSFFSHICFQPEAGKIRMLDLPKIMRDQLDMRVIDIMSRTLESFEPAYLEKMRKAADDHGCIITNLKCNQKGLDMSSANEERRAEALRIYKESIDAAHLLGARWVRPVAGSGKLSDRARLIDSFRQLADHGASRGISIIVENTGWIAGDAKAIPDIINAVGRGKGVDAGPDTGNWKDDEIRYAGLAAAYPLAVTSDYKAFQLEPDGSHPKYDLKRCFDAGWNAGFRGPWCIEHFHTDLPGLIKGFGQVRDKLRGWITAAKSEANA